MTCHLFVAKPLPEPMLTYFQWDPQWTLNPNTFQKMHEWGSAKCHSRKCIREWGPPKCQSSQKISSKIVSAKCPPFCWSNFIPHIIMKQCTCVYSKGMNRCNGFMYMDEKPCVYFDRYSSAQYSFAHLLNQKACGDRCRCVFRIFTYTHLLLIWDDDFVFFPWIFSFSQDTDRPQHL